MMEPLAQDFTPNDTLDIIMKAFGEMNVDELPVVNNRLERKLIGIIHKKDVIDAYNKEILKRDMVSSVSSYISSLAQFKQIAKQLNVKCKRGNETGRL
ncbi:CBS domain-containing protein [Thermincola ferriacetica]